MEKPLLFPVPLCVYRQKVLILLCRYSVARHFYMVFDCTEMLKEYTKSAMHDQPITQRKGLYHAILIHSCMCVKDIDVQ